MSPHDVVIVGGGVIGLSVAYELARRGATATVVDRDDLGRPASWAGAGMISPAGDRPPFTALGRLRARSADLFPEWSAALRDETGIDNGYRICGGLDIALDDDEDQALRAASGRWRDEGIAWERLAVADLPKVEPTLSPEIRSAYFLADRAQIRNPRHLRALRTALARRGVPMIVGGGVRGFRASREEVESVRLADGTELPCKAVVVSAGPWTERLAESLNARVPTPPVKGQMVLLKVPGNGPRRIIEHGHRYLVPRDDGRILVGATEEDAGFDTRTTAEGVRGLIDEAIRLCPMLAHAEVEAAWAGLRPGSMDTRPTIGRLPGLANVFIAAGHRRAGLQQSTATAEIVADLLLGRTPAIDPADFRPDREPAWRDESAFRS